jgi:15-cis-phytoene synthase
LDFGHFDAKSKALIEADIQQDFDYAYQEGIRKLPVSARFGVYLAYRYYIKLFRKIQLTSAEGVLKERIRIPNFRKLSILVRSYLRHQLNYM